METISALRDIAVNYVVLHPLVGILSCLISVILAILALLRSADHAQEIAEQREIIKDRQKAYEQALADYAAAQRECDTLVGEVEKQKMVVHQISDVNNVLRQEVDLLQEKNHTLTEEVEMLRPLQEEMFERLMDQVVFFLKSVHSSEETALDLRQIEPILHAHFIGLKNILELVKEISAASVVPSLPSPEEANVHEELTLDVSGNVDASIVELNDLIGNEFVVAILPHNVTCVIIDEYLRENDEELDLKDLFESNAEHVRKIKSPQAMRKLEIINQGLGSHARAMIVPRDFDRDSFMDYLKEEHASLFEEMSTVAWINGEMSHT